jgi:hypothetical protein
MILHANMGYYLTTNFLRSGIPGGGCRQIYIQVIEGCAELYGW